MEDQQITPTSNPLDDFFNISFDETTRAQVRTAAIWAKISTLCTFIGYGIALVVAFFGQPGRLSETEGSRAGSFVKAGSIVGALISVGIGVFINYYLYRFATATAKGMETMDTIKTNEGFNSLRIYFKIIGIFLIIGFSLAALGLLLVIIGKSLGQR